MLLAVDQFFDIWGALHKHAIQQGQETKPAQVNKSRFPIPDSLKHRSSFHPKSPGTIRLHLMATSHLGMKSSELDSESVTSDILGHWKNKYQILPEDTFFVSKGPHMASKSKNKKMASESNGIFCSSINPC